MGLYRATSGLGTALIEVPPALEMRIRAFLNYAGNAPNWKLGWLPIEVINNEKVSSGWSPAPASSGYQITTNLTSGLDALARQQQQNYANVVPLVNGALYGLPYGLTIQSITSGSLYVSSTRSGNNGIDTVIFTVDSPPKY